MKRTVKWIGIVLGGLIGLAVLGGVVLYPIGMKNSTRSYPTVHVEAINIPTDPDAVGRGKQVAIVQGCAKCHGENLGGMLLTHDPFLGTIVASNLTAGKGGIASSYTDTDWIRAIRYGIKPDSRAEIFMDDYYTLSDQDLGELIAYLKQIPPIASNYPAMRVGPLSAIVLAIGLFTPAADRADRGASRLADPEVGATMKDVKLAARWLYLQSSPPVTSPQ